MKILTIIGTRPEIIRLSLIINKLDKICHHILVHTGQNFDTRLSDIFFRELEVRKPDYLLGIKEGSFTKQISSIFIKVERILLQEKPDKILILGDTNSGLSSIVAKKIGIPVYHLEAGNRCYDESVPEEINRKIIDHTSTFLLPYTKGSRNNLLHEGFKDKSIFVIGNPIYEVIKHFHLKIDHSRILEHLQLRPKKYFLVTIHRGENVDIKDRLISLMKALNI
ncbi:MAG: UDP-N-acetylglucosamine 2-epimerase, partial [Actinobacteria bacterium]|nr:UDP-N-acetylglucosamine 2-epimerase [Actinomycetota bacterium]